MQWPRGARLIAHNILWAVLLSAFLFVNLPEIIHQTRPEPTHLFGAFHSSDSILEVTTETKAASEKLVLLFESLPSSKTILVLVHYKDPWSQLLGEIMAYLSWPHPVRILDVADANAARDLAAIKPASLAAFVFCGVEPPPWLRHGWSFGRALKVVPVSSEPER